MNRGTWVAALLIAACSETGGSHDGGVDRDGAMLDGGGTREDAGVDGSAPLELVVDDGYVADDDAHLPNPERGIYYWSPNAADPHTLVAAFLYLGEHCDEELVWNGHHASGTSGVLDTFADTLVAHRAAGRKVVFRPRYDTSASSAPNRCGLFHADGDELQRRHVSAIAAMLGELRDVIAFVEAGYLGRWGEWNWAGYSASNAPILASPEQRRALMSHILTTYHAAGLTRFVGFRRPVFAKELVDTDPARGRHAALYNDCFMTNASDYGTYSNFESDNPSNFASVEAAIGWSRTFTRTAPFGGETCPLPDGGERWRSCENMVGPGSEPASLHMSYLHGGYAVDAREVWQAGGCYDEMKRRLGYRFEVVDMTYPPSARAGQRLVVRVRLRNSGWSRMHNPRRAYLVLRGVDASYLVGGALDGYVSLDADESGHETALWEPGEEVTFEQRFDAPSAGEYSLRLYLPDPDRPDVSGYAVRLASLRDGEPLFDPEHADNDLGVTIRVR